MSDEPRDPDAPIAECPEDDDREAILSRRRRFVVAALSSLALSSCASTVGNADGAPAPDVVDASTGPDSRPQPCLGALPPDVLDDEATPQPCLEIAPPDDAGEV